MGAPFSLPDSAEVVRADLDAMLAEHAQALHLRRQLRDALDHGTAVLAALGLPRLVGPDFAPIDREAAGDALDAAVAVLDALDGDPDLEDDGTAEAEPDDEDDRTAEPSLGAPERSPWVCSLGDRYYEPRAGAFARRRFQGGSQFSWAQGARQDGEGEPEAGYDLACDEDELDDDDSDMEPSLGWPNDFRAVLSDAFQVDHDPEADDADLEPDGERMVVARRLGLHEPPARDLVARAKAIRCGKAAPAEPLPRPWIGAPRVFGLHVVGDCCAPHILNNGAVHVDMEAVPKPGDFVALWFEAERAGRRVMVAWVKRLAMGLPDGMVLPFKRPAGSGFEHVLMVDSLNPPRRYVLLASAVHAVLKVIDILPPAVAVAARVRRRQAEARQ